MAKTDFDYIIIGSGIAGLNTALLAREHGSVLIVTKAVPPFMGDLEEMPRSRDRGIRTPARRERWI